MAEANNNPKTILGSNNNSNFFVEQPSRLTRSTKDLRNSLISRNLYTNFNEYPLQPDTTQRIVNSVSSVINAIAPFKSVDLNNTVFSRLITLPNTPLTDIGLAVLGQQFAYNFASNVAQETFPTIKLSNIWDGDPNTKLFSKNRNYRITNRETATTLDNFIERFVGFYPAKNYPFDKNTTNAEILRNTGDVQLEFLMGSINKNIYKTEDQTYQDVGLDINVPINKRSDIIYGKNDRSSSDVKIFFDFYNKDFNPYISDSEFITDSSIDNANNEMRQAYSQVNTQEYAPNSDFVENNLGDVKKEQGDFNEETGFNEDINNQIVWGRDGVSRYVSNRLEILRGLEDSDINENNNISDKFNGRLGLLKYTQNLLNASGGKFVDQTKKKFNTGNNPRTESFNGSGLWTSNNSDYAANRRIAGITGVRQHTILDQYNRFAKTIRFDGNQVYNGNENSVVYKSVLPRIHPTLNEETGELDNKNLMFSFENLAVKVFKNESYGIIDDEYGTQIPLSEVGPTSGRMMWFPPYGIELTEVSSAKYDSNVFVGRSEPIYTYMHSERSATLSFMMIMDYPPHVRNLRNGNHEDLAKFFAFGGDNYSQTEVIDNIPKKEEDNKKRGGGINGDDRIERPENIIYSDKLIVVSFPNDMPNSGQVNSIVDLMYGTYEYEIAKNLTPNSGDINDEIYNLTGLTKTNTGYTLNVPAGFSQYTYEGIKSTLDERLFQAFNNEDQRQYIEINLIGRSSKLYTPDDDADVQEQERYNLLLSRRRAESIKIFIQSRIKKLFGQKAVDAITINTFERGDQDAKPENATVEAIPDTDTKLERSVFISFDPTDAVPERVEKQLTPEDRQAVETLLEENSGLQDVQNNQDRGSIQSNYVMNERKSNPDANQDDGILKGFKSLTDNYFYPAFHSQTPEDFHRRLTFLQQCTRQGSSIRSKSTTDDNGVERVRNSAFGRQPICILRIGDFFNTKVVIESVTYDYTDAPWDLNPEGFGMQPMIAEITIQMKVLGGQSLKGPIDALQNAVSFNYYANSTYSNRGLYLAPSYVEALQYSDKEGVSTTLDELQGRIDAQVEAREELLSTLEKSKRDNE